MKTVGIIAEYNPFHNGHLYQMKKAKELTQADFVVVIMSGSYVQRGLPAFADKFSRSDMALACGADLVIELPVRYATASAEYFAYGAVSILENLGVDSICFGSECGDIEILKEIADYIQKDCDEFNNQIVNFVKNGFSYPVARKEALLHCMQTKNIVDNSLKNNTINNLNRNDLKCILESPNNILAIEYLKSLSFFKSKIKPYTIKRVCTGYHEEELLEQEKNHVIINSATAIRQSLMESSDFTAIEKSMPKAAFQILMDRTQPTFPIVPDDLSDYLYYKLWETSFEELHTYFDVSKDLARTIWNQKNEFSSFTEFSLLLKSKQITQTRINRSLLHILLGIKDFSLKDKTALEINPYARVLGFKKEASVLLKQAKLRDYPVITKTANAKDLLDESGFSMLSEDIRATQLYNQMVFRKFGVRLKNDFLRTPTVK